MERSRIRGECLPRKKSSPHHIVPISLLIVEWLSWISDVLGHKKGVDLEYKMSQHVQKSTDSRGLSNVLVIGKSALSFISNSKDTRRELQHRQHSMGSCC